jgi:hypothetical protein
MRRNDYDVTDRIQTTLVAPVRDEVVQLYRTLYDSDSERPIERAFEAIECSYGGRDPQYHACDTAYHDIQHILDVTLAMARLMDGYERGRREGAEPLPPALFRLGVVTALFHDFGYLRRRSDRRHRHGAEYTLTHVSRGSRYLRHNLEQLGMAKLAPIAAQLVHFTGYERPTESIRLSDPLLRRIGHMLGTADIVAQMADRCYLEKCRDRLYPEFVLGGLTQKRMPGGRYETMFSSGQDLVQKTPGFYVNARKRLDLQLARAYDYAERHFRGQNLYLEEMEKNVRHAQVMAAEEDPDMLRRTPPYTLLGENEQVPEELVIR